MESFEIVPARELVVGDRVRPLGGKRDTDWRTWWCPVTAVGTRTFAVEVPEGVPLDASQPRRGLVARAR